MKQLTYLLIALLFCVPSRAQQTYCNPMNLDYGYTPIPNFSEWGRHRATADPVIITFKGDYYLFSTNQWGYWWSSDLLNWNFVERKFLKPWHKVYDELCAPAAFVMGDTMFVYGSTWTKSFPVWMSTNPKKDEWKEAIDSLQVGAWDPAFLEDDDHRLYVYWGSGNKYPLYGQELNRKTFEPIGAPTPVWQLNQDQYGWHRFGENLDNVPLDPFIEGAWVTKYKGKYYLQYGAPGTETSHYADGVAIADKPLGPFVHQLHNPFSYKPGGFIRGAGHGATFQDKWKNYWHVSTMGVVVKNSFERRNGLWPAGFDKDGVMYANTAFGDYPHYLDNSASDHLKSRFTGWMLLNYNKPVRVSSTLGNYQSNNAVDESIKTYWSAASSKKGEWIESDLGTVSNIHAVQVNYADQDVDSSFLGKVNGIYHQYILYHSMDGKNWKMLVDKSTNRKDVPHDYVQLKTPVKARYVKLVNHHMPTGKFAISGLRVFGKGNGNAPKMVQGFSVWRGDNDKRAAWIRWMPSTDAYAYNIYFGVAPDKLYNSVMVHNSNEYVFKSMDKSIPYYFQIEAINENGVSVRTPVSMVE